MNRIIFGKHEQGYLIPLIGILKSEIPDNQDFTMNGFFTKYISEKEYILFEKSGKIISFTK